MADQQKPKREDVERAVARDMREEENRNKTLGQRQGDLNPRADRDVPEGDGIGQMGQRNPAAPGNKGVDHPKPGQG